MTRAEWIQRKRRRYLANILSQFEDTIEPLLRRGGSTDVAVDQFKRLVRAKVNALAVDSIRIFELEGEDTVAINALAEDLKDRLRSN